MAINNASSFPATKQMFNEHLVQEIWDNYLVSLR